MTPSCVAARPMPSASSISSPIRRTSSASAVSNTSTGLARSGAPGRRTCARAGAPPHAGRGSRDRAGPAAPPSRPARLPAAPWAISSSLDARFHGLWAGRGMWPAANRCRARAGDAGQRGWVGSGGSSPRSAVGVVRISRGAVLPCGRISTVGAGSATSNCFELPGAGVRAGLMSGGGGDSRDRRPDSPEPL